MQEFCVTEYPLWEPGYHTHYSEQTVGLCLVYMKPSVIHVLMADMLNAFQACCMYKYKNIFHWLSFCSYKSYSPCMNFSQNLLVEIVVKITISCFTHTVLASQDFCCIRELLVYIYIQFFCMQDDGIVIRSRSVLHRL